MKTQTFLMAIVATVSVSAVTPPAGTISSAPNSATDNTNQFGLGNLTISNRLGQTYSADEIQSQLAELHRAVQQSTPVVTAITETYSNSVPAAKPSVVGGIAGVLGGFLNRDTNSTSGQATASSTNVLGRILQGAVSAVTTNSAPANPAALRDFVSLQEHLQAMAPILQRLNISTNPVTPFGVGGTENGSTVEKGQSRD